MTLLIIGLALWFIAHGFKPLAPKLRQSLADRMGEEKSKGPFGLGIMLSIVLIIFGWRRADPSILLYQAPDLHLITALLTFLALYLITASTAAIRLRRWIRHPQLVGVAAWSIGHLLSNGELRSVLLFGTMAVWALLLIPFINKRDGSYQAPEAGSWGLEFKHLAIALVVTAVLVFTHQWFTAVNLLAS